MVGFSYLPFDPVENDVRSYQVARFGLLDQLVGNNLRMGLAGSLADFLDFDPELFRDGMFNLGGTLGIARLTGFELLG